MIDRGALVLAPRAGSLYRGLYRTPLDGVTFSDRRGRDVARRYAELLVEGEGVIEDLDDALALRSEAGRHGAEALDVVVFAVPQTPWVPKGLPVVEAPPADDLEPLGWDVVEPLEPWFSPLATAASENLPLNAHGLFEDRNGAERHAAHCNETDAPEDPYVAVRVWRVKG